MPLGYSGDSDHNIPNIPLGDLEDDDDCAGSGNNLKLLPCRKRDMLVQVLPSKKSNV